MAFADRIAVLKDGKLQQFDTPCRSSIIPQTSSSPVRADANEYVRGDCRWQSPLGSSQYGFRLPITDFSQRLLGNRTAVRQVRPGASVSARLPRKPASRNGFWLLRIWNETRVGVRYGDVLMMASTGMTKAYKPSKVNLIFVRGSQSFDQDTVNDSG